MRAAGVPPVRSAFEDYVKSDVDEGSSLPPKLIRGQAWTRSQSASLLRSGGTPVAPGADERMPPGVLLFRGTA
jgi:hypothetical protein